MSKHLDQRKIRQSRHYVLPIPGDELSRARGRTVHERRPLERDGI